MRGIYKIINKINNKVYIGESLDIDERWKLHKNELNNNSHHSYKLQRDWNEYGECNFEFSIICVLEDDTKKMIDRHLLLIYEDIYIKQYNSIEEGYNVENTIEKIMSGNKRVTMIRTDLLEEYSLKVKNGFYIVSNGVVKRSYYSMLDVEKHIGITRATIKKRMVKLNMLIKSDKEYIFNKEYFNKNNMLGSRYMAKFNMKMYNKIIEEIDI